MTAAHPEPRPGESEEPRLSSLIVYAKSSGHESNVAKSANDDRNRLEGVAFLFVAAAILYAMTSLGATWWMYVLLVLFSIGGVLLYRKRIVQPADHELRAIGDLPERPASNARVACAGNTWNLARLARREPIDDIAFEPISMHGVTVSETVNKGFWRIAVFFLASLAALHMLDWIIGWKINSYWLFSPALGLATLGVGATWPTYARIVPGRIDIFRGSFLGRRLSVIKTIDLRSSAVLVDLNQHCVFTARDGTTTEIGFGTVRDRGEFAHAVLLAAVSTHTPAPLPDDALVG